MKHITLASIDRCSPNWPGNVRNTPTSVRVIFTIIMTNSKFKFFFLFLKKHLALLNSGLHYRNFLWFWMSRLMAPHSSTLAWKIPWTEEPGGLQSMGSLRVGHDWATWLSLFTFMHWRRKWQPTPVFLPGEFQGRGSPVGCCLWGRTESDTTEVT